MALFIYSFQLISLDNLFYDCVLLCFVSFRSVLVRGFFVAIIWHDNGSPLQVTFYLLSIEPFYNQSILFSIAAGCFATWAARVFHYGRVFCGLECPACSATIGRFADLGGAETNYQKYLFGGGFGRRLDKAFGGFGLSFDCRRSPQALL